MNRRNRRRSYDSNSTYDSSEDYEEEDVTYESDRVRVKQIMDEIGSITDQFDDLNWRLHELSQELHTLSRHHHRRSDIVDDEDDPGLQQQKQQQASDDDASVVVVGGKETEYLSTVRNDIDTHLRKWSDAYRWVRHCIALRSNDPSITSTGQHDDVEWFTHQQSPVPSNYGQILSDCLRYNTYVTHITFYMNDLTLGRRRPSTMTISEDTRALLDYVQTSTILQRVTLKGGPSTHTRDMATVFFAAIAMNPTIQHVTCTFLFNIPLESLSALISSTTSIKALSLRCDNWASYTPAQQMLLVQAMACNQSIERLHLYFVDDDGAMVSLLQSLTHSLMPLQTLMLKVTWDVTFPSLTLFLQSNTTPLHHLELKGLILDAANVECIVQGLRQGQFSNTISPRRSNGITKLSLDFFDYDDEGATSFISFLRSPLINQNRIQESDGDDSFLTLQELHIKFDEDNLATHAPGAFGNLPLGHAMALMIVPMVHTNMDLSSNNSVLDRNAISVPVTPSLQPQQKTIGSQIRTLSLHPFDRMVTSGFCDTIRSNAHVVQLSCLRLSHVRQRDCRQLVSCLPYLLSLQELHLNMAENENLPSEDCLQLLEQSGSISTMSVMDHNGSSLWGPHDFHIQRAFCQRNQNLGDLLLCNQVVIHRSGHENSIMGQCSRILSANGCIGCSEATDDNRETADDDIRVLLFPTLLQVAKQVPFTRLSTLFSSLLLVKVVAWRDARTAANDDDDYKPQPPSRASSTTAGSVRSPPRTTIAQPHNVVDNMNAPHNNDQQRRRRGKRKNQQ